jgi:hypothetical protein
VHLIQFDRRFLILSLRNAAPIRGDVLKIKQVWLPTVHSFGRACTSMIYTHNLKPVAHFKGKRKNSSTWSGTHLLRIYRLSVTAQEEEGL